MLHLDFNKTAKYTETIAKGISIVKVKHFFTPAQIEQVVNTLKAIPNKLKHESEYMGITQTNYGFRNSVFKSQKLREEYNDWFTSSLACLAEPLFTYQRDFLEGYWITRDKKDSYPIFHELHKAVEDSNGAHTDCAHLSQIEAHSNRAGNLTWLMYFNLPNKGGGIHFLSKDGDVLVIHAELGDLIVFDSKTIHDIHPFTIPKTQTGRISMVSQMTLVNGSFKQFI